MAAPGADDPLADRVGQAERAAEGQHPGADAGLVAVAEPGGGQVVATQLEHGDVGLGVGPDLAGWRTRPSCRVIRMSAGLGPRRRDGWSGRRGRSRPSGRTMTPEPVSSTERASGCLGPPSEPGLAGDDVDDRRRDGPGDQLEGAVDLREQLVLAVQFVVDAPRHPEPPARRLRASAVDGSPGRSPGPTASDTRWPRARPSAMPTASVAASSSGRGGAGHGRRSPDRWRDDANANVECGARRLRGAGRILAPPKYTAGTVASGQSGDGDAKVLPIRKSRPGTSETAAGTRSRAGGGRVMGPGQSSTRWAGRDQRPDSLMSISKSLRLMSWSLSSSPCRRSWPQRASTLPWARSMP